MPVRRGSVWLCKEILSLLENTWQDRSTSSMHKLGGMAYKMIGKFKAWQVRIGVLEVNDDELFVLIGWK